MSSSSSSSTDSSLTWSYHRYGGDFNVEFQQESVNIPTITDQNDILVKNYAVGLNPTDNKQRTGAYGGSGESKEPIIGGRDASGVIIAIGKNVVDFKIGDEVFYAGDNSRSGSFSQYTLVDYRIVGRKPSSLTHEQAASLPLAAITVYEGLYEKLNPTAGHRILITAAAGGVGSLAIQLSKIWGLHVTATASRNETSEWVKSLGADEVIDHSKPLLPQIDNNNKFHYIFNCHDDSMLDELMTVIRPRGHIVSILPFTKDNISAIRQAFFLSVSIHFELMFSRSGFGYEQEKQGSLLNLVSKWVDEGKIKSPTTKVFEWNDFKQAFALLVTGKTIGKTVVKVPQ